MSTNENAFAREYQRAVTDVLPFVTRQLQEQLAEHDPGLHPDVFDFENYLRRSSGRYVRAVRMFDRQPLGTKPRMLDVGGYLAAFPLALARLGMSTTIAEAYDYYEGSLDPLRDYVVSQGVRCWNVDFTQDLGAEPFPTFELVTNMAMIEHIAGSPKQLMGNLRSATSAKGFLVLEVPNIAYWPKRRQALRGESIHPPLRSIYDAEQPFLGHHHEYTVGEVGELLAWSGFDQLEVETFNYSISPRDGGNLLGRAVNLARFPWPAVWFERCREVILTIARPSGPEH